MTETKEIFKYPENLTEYITHNFVRNWYFYDDMYELPRLIPIIYFIDNTAPPHYINLKKLINFYNYLMCIDPQYQFINSLKRNKIDNTYIKPLIRRFVRETHQFIKMRNNEKPETLQYNKYLNDMIKVLKSPKIKELNEIKREHGYRELVI